MDDLQQQKSQIDEVARRAKDEADRAAIEARTLLAYQEAERVKEEAAKKASQIQNDAQK